MTEALAVYETQALAPSLNMVEALALMSEQEFSAKLQAMKLAQKRIADLETENANLRKERTSGSD